MGWIRGEDIIECVDRWQQTALHLDRIALPIQTLARYALQQKNIIESNKTVQPYKPKLILIDTNSNSSFLFYITLDVHFWYSRRQTSNCDTFHVANQGQLLLL